MSLRDRARAWLREQLAPDPAPATRRRRRDEEELTARARERQQQAREAADLRKIATDPDVQALALETAQKRVEKIAYCGIVGGLAFTMVNVQQFAAQGEEAKSLVWIAAWLLDPVVSAVLIATLVANRTLSRYGVDMGRLPGIVALVCVAATYVMNTWESWGKLLAGGSASGVVLHSIPPLIVYLGIEALPVLRQQFSVAIARAHEDAQGKPAEPELPAVPEVPDPAGLPEVNAARQVAGKPPVTSEVPDPAGTRPPVNRVPDPGTPDLPDPGTPDLPDPATRPEGGEVPDPDAVPAGMPSGNPADNLPAWIEWLRDVNLDRAGQDRPMIGALIFNRWCKDAGRSVNKDRNAEVVREAKAAATIRQEMRPAHSSVVQLRR